MRCACAWWSPPVSPAAVADSPAASVQLQQPMALKAARPAARPAFASAAQTDGDKAQAVVDLNLSSHTMPVPCLIWRCWPWCGRWLAKIALCVSQSRAITAPALFSHSPSLVHTRARVVLGLILSASWMAARHREASQPTELNSPTSLPSTAISSSMGPPG